MKEEIASNKFRKVFTKIKVFSMKPITKKLLIAIMVLAVAYGIFYLGQQSGIAKQKELNKKVLISEQNKTPSSTTPRKSFIGTITSVDEKNLELTTTRGDKAKIVINSSTRITGSDAKKTDSKSLKKDQKVMVSSVRNKDDTYTATRIRIQK